MASWPLRQADMVPATADTQMSTQSPDLLPGQTWRAAAQRASQAAPELAWMNPRRQQALARVLASGLPSTRDEAWRYTDLSEFESLGLASLDAQPLAITNAGSLPVKAAASSLPLLDDAARILVRDGRLEAPLPPLPAGLSVASLRSASPDMVAATDAVLAGSDGAGSTTLMDLNTALLEDAVIVRAGAAAAPHSLHIELLAGDQARMVHPRLIVDVSAGTSLTLLLEQATGQGTVVNAVTQIRLGAGAHLQLIRLQSLPADALLTDNIGLSVAEDATVSVLSMELGARLTRLDLAIQLNGTGASVGIHGIFLADGQRHVDNHFSVAHRAPRTVSRQSVRGIAAGSGRGVFNGRILVEAGAAGANATLNNRNLLLSTTAEIDTRPELEIHVDDVRCSHGATTGQLDPGALFYLQSRGLDPADARDLLTSAFLREGLESLHPSALRTALEERLAARLSTLGRTGS